MDAILLTMAILLFIPAAYFYYKVIRYQTGYDLHKNLADKLSWDKKLLEKENKKFKFFMQRGFTCTKMINGREHYLQYVKTKEIIEIKLYDLEGKSHSYLNATGVNRGVYVIRVNKMNADCTEHETIMKELLINESALVSIVDEDQLSDVRM